MGRGKMLSPGDVILTKCQFTDSFEIKIRPAVVVCEEFDNVVLAGITSNTQMRGIPLTKKEGAIKDSVIKLNYLFTVSKILIEKNLFSLTLEKRKLVFEGLMKRLKEISP